MSANPSRMGLPTTRKSRTLSMPSERAAYLIPFASTSPEGGEVDLVRAGFRPRSFGDWTKSDPASRARSERMPGTGRPEPLVEEALPEDVVERAGGELPGQAAQPVHRLELLGAGRAEQVGEHVGGGVGAVEVLADELDREELGDGARWRSSAAARWSAGRRPRRPPAPAPRR